MYWTDDPVRDAARYEAEQERQLKKLPRCCECRERIQTDECYEFDGELICPDCLMSNHKDWTENYIEG